jgi:putative spermidine/putrescine transport system permease protein
MAGRSGHPNYTIPRTVWLAVPAMLFLILFFLAPMITMVRNSFNTQLASGIMAPDFTFANYARFFGTEIYRHVLIVTLRIGIVTTLIAIIVAYPLAWVVARGPKLAARMVLLIVVMPLLVNIVARTFGWRIILGRSGPFNMALDWLGIEVGHLFLYTESAVVVGSLHVFLPLMVLPLTNSLGAIPRNLEESAAALGASRIEVFAKVILPLSLPGIGAGAILVFTLTTSSFVLPAILGGDFSKMLGTLVEEQLLSVSNWPFGSAIATIMMLLNFAVVLGYGLVVDRRLRAWAGAAS